MPGTAVVSFLVSSGSVRHRSQSTSRGGVDAASARQYLDAGARVLGIGSALEDPAQLDKRAELLREW